VIFAGLVFDGGLRGTRFVSRGIAFAVVALVLFAVVTVSMAGPIKSAGWLPVVLVSRIANSSASGVLLVLSLTGSPRLAAFVSSSAERTRAAFVVVVLAGLLDVLGFISFAIGLEVAETWLVGLSSSFGPAVAVLVAVAFMGERLRPTQWLGLAGIAIGLMMVTLS
jgi:drug/metabolite transporter (DMT)-like permease